MGNLILLVAVGSGLAALVLYGIGWLFEELDYDARQKIRDRESRK